MSKKSVFQIQIKAGKALDTLASDINRYTEASQNAIKKAVQKGTIAIRDEAIRNSPYRTGALRRSISANYEANGYVGVVKAKVQHAALVEFGTNERFAWNRKNHARIIGDDFVRGTVSTGSMPKKPFLRPAYEKNKEAIFEEIRKAVELKE